MKKQDGSQASRVAASGAEGYGKFKFELRGISTRVVVIPEHITLQEVHRLVQILFGWYGGHLWEFRDSTGRTYGRKHNDQWIAPSEGRLIPPSDICLSDILPERGGKLYYTYDFGDDWQHLITRMADPKMPGKYCVKTEGPDGIEDCGGVWRLQECKSEWHVPGVDEITQRLERVNLHPKKSGTGLLKMECEELEAVIKTLDDVEWGWLYSLGEEGFARVFQRSERFDRLIARLPDIRYLKMTSSFMGADVYDAGPEFRRYWRKMRDAWTRLRDKAGRSAVAPSFDSPVDAWGEIYKFACAAACLYGAVSESDLCELFDKWREETDWLKKATPETAAYALQLLRREMTSHDASVYFSDGLAISIAKYPQDPSTGLPSDDALETMLKMRRGRERWYPDTYADFIAYSIGDFTIPEEYDALEDFLVQKWNLTMKDPLEVADVDDVISSVYFTFAAGCGWKMAVEAVDARFGLSDLTSHEFSELTKILMNAANATRNDLNWGYTPNEMVAIHCQGDTASPLAASYGLIVAPNAPIVRTDAKVGRNDPCPCGSGKKFKKCCGKGND